MSDEWRTISVKDGLTSNSVVKLCPWAWRLANGIMAVFFALAALVQVGNLTERIKVNFSCSQMSSGFETFRCCFHASRLWRMILTSRNHSFLHSSVLVYFHFLRLNSWTFAIFPNSSMYGESCNISY